MSTPETRATSSDFGKGWIQERVHTVLEFYPGTRDNDELLAAHVWVAQLDKMGKPQSSFLEVYGNGSLASAEAIVRARRIIQKDHLGLRGTTWETRQKHSVKVATAITQGSDPNVDVVRSPTGVIL
jgi:hypothetical protein